MLGHFERPDPKFSERRSCWGSVVIDARYSVAYGLGAVAGESGPVVDPFPFAVAWHWWEVSTAS